MTLLKLLEEQNISLLS